MDHAAQGAKALEAKDFSLAVTHYSSAIAAHPRAPDYYIKRSAAYTRVSPPNYLLALLDAETAVVLARERGKRELIGQAQLRRAIALFNSERYADAGQCLKWAKFILSKDNSITIWENKTQVHLEKLETGDDRAEVRVKEVPDVDMEGIEAKAAASKVETKKETSAAAEATPSASATLATPAAYAVTPATKIRHEWYQSNDTVTLTLLAKGVPKDKTTVDLQPQSIAIAFPTATDSNFDFSLDPLYAVIDPAKSSYKVMSTKIEVILSKAQTGQKWHSLEAAAGSASVEQVETGTDKPTIPQAVLAVPPESTGPAYPTSSKHGAKDWDKLVADLTKKPTKEDGGGGGGGGGADADSDDDGDPVNGFFKKIYKDADPDTRRAMMKSYQESNGTALSTKWADVKKGPVETSPPEGMEARKWGA